jgi:flavin reductase (DIM6/NTAB) family NADH-FMN oxidoreductase RutF
MELRTLTIDDINGMDKVYRLNLINSVSGFKSANLIGTTDGEGHHNLAIFSSVIHLGSDPPLLGMIVRPTTVPRHTYQNMISSGLYTINHVNSRIINKAHQTSAKYEKEESEFDKVGLSPQFINGFEVPFVLESDLKMAMELVEEIDIRSNGTKMIVGQIREIHLPLETIGGDGLIDLKKTDTVTISGLDTYWSPERLERFGYARP